MKTRGGVDSFLIIIVRRRRNFEGFTLYVIDSYSKSPYILLILIAKIDRFPLYTDIKTSNFSRPPSAAERHPPPQ